MSDVHPASLADDELLAACEVRRVRRSGPGGQHRNKVETGVVLRHLPSGLQAEANERRRQSENKTVALFRLRLLLALELRSPKNPEDHQPSDLWRGRCRNQRIRVNPSHSDFPVLLAEAMDAVFDANLEVATAAEGLDCTSSQLIKLVKLCPPAWQRLNQERSQRGLGILK